MAHQIKKFPNKIEFWKYISELDEKLNFTNTIKLPNLWFYYDNTKYPTKSSTLTFNKLNELLGTKFNSELSAVTGSRITLYISPDVQEDVQEDVDWEWVGTLEDTKEDKLLLDQYAEKFNVKLKRNMKLQNMVKVFKKQLK